MLQTVFSRMSVQQAALEDRASPFSWAGGRVGLQNPEDLGSLSLTFLGPVHTHRRHSIPGPLGVAPWDLELLQTCCSVLSAVRSSVSDPGVSWLLLPSMKPWKTHLSTCTFLSRLPGRGDDGAAFRVMSRNSQLWERRAFLAEAFLVQSQGGVWK